AIEIKRKRGGKIMSRVSWKSVFIALGFCVGTAMACGPPPPYYGFQVMTLEAYFDADTGARLSGDYPIAVQASGQWVSDGPGAHNSLYSFGPLTVDGFYNVNNARVPATWNVTQLSGDCEDEGASAYVPGDTAIFQSECRYYLTLGFAIAPNPILSQEDGGEGYQITMTGSGIDGTYGLPTMLLFYPDGGGVSYSGNPVSWAPDWSWCTSNWFTPVYPGQHLMVVANAGPNGELYTVGGGWLTAN
ncbi:MAG TPA: hypothetical protein VFW83_00290, partial [Bryobacteraceae bacterium]|nr:hypothetical protein [Bryobacteraceae bacterium]